MEHIDAVKAYFDAWLSKEEAVLSSVFADDVVYSESHGSQYRGLTQILRWFADWNQRGTVLQWEIRNAVECGNTLCAQWVFRCEYEGNVDGFDGVSWIEFDEQGKIKTLREFQAGAEHYFPYGDM